jgi:hypothetical protein
MRGGCREELASRSSVSYNTEMAQVLLEFAKACEDIAREAQA